MKNMHGAMMSFRCVVPLTNIFVGSLLCSEIWHMSKCVLYLVFLLLETLQICLAKLTCVGWEHMSHI